MWILSFIPEYLIHFVLVVGIAALVATSLFSFKIFEHYTLPIRIIATIVVCFALWIEGGISNERVWKQRVAALEVKLSKAEARSAVITREVVERIVYRDRAIQKKAQKVIEYVDREVRIYDNTCPIPQPFVDALNMAAEKPVDEQ